MGATERFRQEGTLLNIVSGIASIGPSRTGKNR